MIILCDIHWQFYKDVYVIFWHFLKTKTSMPSKVHIWEKAVFKHKMYKRQYLTLRAKLTLNKINQTETDSKHAVESARSNKD